jgi:hypothetical protein
MQQLLIACALILCLLTIYVVIVEGEVGLKHRQKQAHDVTTEYVRGIDA